MLDAEHVLAHLGIGQMYIHRGKHDTTIEIVEKLHNSQPACIEVMKVSSSLYELARKRDKSIVFFFFFLTNF